ncbi:class D beta-lactamase [Siminovitchia sediminis]|uniref:Beta-lactamase n=1 Tax=Siminovitchia sediminis TaxID=1274353 RepID=A0ABW4KGY7_9BACI
MKKYVVAMILLLSVMPFVLGTGTAMGAEKEKAKELDAKEFFDGKEGTAVLKNLKTGSVYVYNRERGTKRYTPESTFKVPNALIGLETSAVRDEYEVKRWDGVVRNFDNWNRDHSLASAMRESAIWFYQDMAKDIGETRMKEYIRKMHYGNEDITGGIDSFWLGSSLKISAYEQAAFIEKLVKEELPFAEKQQKTVKRMIVQDEQDEYTLYGKTGTRLSDMGLGWYVGFVKSEKNTWVFAVNVNSTGTEAKNITLDILKEKNIIKKK